MVIFLEGPVRVSEPEVLGPLKLELEVVVSCPMWALDLNLCHLQEMKMFLTAEPSIEAQLILFEEGPENPRAKSSSWCFTTLVNTMITQSSSLLRSYSNTYSYSSPNDNFSYPLTK